MNETFLKKYKPKFYSEFIIDNEYINLCNLYCKYNAIINSENNTTIYKYGKRMIFTLSNAIMNDEFNDIEKKIERLVVIKTNQQLGQFSNIYLNKLKKDATINEN